MSSVFGLIREGYQRTAQPLNRNLREPSAVGRQSQHSGLPTTVPVPAGLFLLGFSDNRNDHKTLFAARHLPGLVFLQPAA